MPKCEVLPLLHFEYDEAKKLGIELGWAKLSLSWDWILKFVPQSFRETIFFGLRLGLKTVI